MTIETHILDGTGNKNSAKVTSLGQLVTSPIEYEKAQFVELGEVDTGYTFFPPVTGKQFIVTGIRVKADRDVSATVDAVVVIYQATVSGSTTVEKVIHQEALVRGESVTLTPLNILIDEGRWLNGKTTDDDIHMSIMGYYVTALSG